MTRCPSCRSLDVYVVSERVKERQGSPPSHATIVRTYRCNACHHEFTR